MSVLRAHPLDGALLFFDRESGENVRLAGPALGGLTRRAPRVVNLGLTNRCNLRCSFCFRDRALPSAWSAGEILSWAGELAAAGVLEIAFGQGEPLAFPGLPALVRDLHASTPLAIGLTTNGLLLTPAVLDELDGAYGQIRLSLYEDNDPFARAAMLARHGARFGVNLLVTPASLPALAETIERLAGAGCADVLLLSYNGPDPQLHLSSEEDRRLARAVLGAHARHGDRLAIKLSVCFGDRLPEVPRVIAPGDCGAGDEFLALDSAKRVLACSFHAEAEPVRSAAEALDRWRQRRRLRRPAGIRGCARGGDLLPTLAAQREPSVVAWRGWASNHSTSYTLVGEMPSAARAAAFVADLERLLARCEARVQGAQGWSDRTSVWEILGREGEPPHPAWSMSAPDLWLWRPSAMAAGGRRVLVHVDSTLADLSVFGHLFLERRGRLLWHAGDEKGSFRLVFGALAGSRAETIAHQLGRALVDRAVVGPRLYGVVPHHEAHRVAPALRDLPWSMALVDETTETLDGAIARPAPLPPRKRRVEWLVLESCTQARYDHIFARDPAAALAEAGWTREHRWPARLTARQLLGGMVVRTEGAPVPAALEHLLLSGGVERFSVVDREDVRIRIDLDRGTESDDPAPRATWERAAAALARHGFTVDVRESRSRIDLLPSRPLEALDHAAARFQGERRTSVEILPAWPLASAIARIDEDLALAGAAPT